MPDLLRKILLSGKSLNRAPDPVLVDNVTPSRDLPAIWQTAPMALALVDGGRVHAWNNSCRSLLFQAVGGSEMAGRRWLSASVTRLLANDRSCEVLAATSDALSLEVRLGPTVPDNPARVVVLREVHGARRGQGDLAETVSTLSHELRTPLTSMKSSLNLVISGDTGPVSTDQAHFLGMTMRNINRLERLVSDLLDVSRTEATGGGLRRRETDIGPVLIEAVQMQEAAARQAGLQLDAAGLPAELVAHVDPDKVVQILTNVVGNAIKYTPEGGLVRVWQEAHPRRDPEAGPGLARQLAERFALPLSTFSLVVQDSGVGMSKEDQDRIFEPWFRGAEDERRQVPGAGLGLHITRSLVEAHGGRIRLASEPGQGTTVWIRLPRDPASEDLLQSARQLQALADRWRTGNIAILDGRATAEQVASPVGPLATGFLRGRADAGDRKIVALVPDLVATVVSTPDIWNSAWENYLKDSGRTETPRWQFLASDRVMDRK